MNQFAPNYSEFDFKVDSSPSRSVGSSGILLRLFRRKRYSVPKRREQELASKNKIKKSGNRHLKNRRKLYFSVNQGDDKTRLTIGFITLNYPKYELFI